MNYVGTQLHAWTQAPLAKALGWSLIHFVWQGVVLAVLLAFLLFLCREGSARLRYALACIALAAMPVALAITIAVSWPTRASVPLLARINVTDAGPLDNIPLTPAPGLGLKAVLPWVPLFWIAGVLIFYARTVGGWMVTRHLQTAGVTAPDDWQARLDALRRRLRVTKPVRLLESYFVDVPVLVGFLRPVVLIPAGLFAGLPADQLEYILIHELAHIRRWDYVVNLLQSLVEGLLFYHPAVWWVSAQIRAERENCCDDVVVNVKGDARGYAAALATLERNRWPVEQPVLAATGGSVMKRIRRLLQEPEGRRTSAAPVFLGLLLISVGVAVASWETQPAPTSPQPVQARKIVTAPERIVVAKEAAVQAVTNHTSRLPVKLVAQAVPPQDPVQQSVSDVSQEVSKRIQEKLRKELDSPYRKWLNEDVAYIILDQERSAFKALETDEEREHFIEQFWLRRDPTPGTPENEMRDEHYRRIAYANEHYSARISGWKTDRGRIYITYGPPDEIESHPSGGAYTLPSEQGGGTIDTVPFEQWLYRSMQGVGTNVVIEFIDPLKNGEYRMTTDPSVKNVVKANAHIANVQVMSTPTADGLKAVLISFPLQSYGDHLVDITATITTSTRRTVRGFAKTGIPGTALQYQQFVSLAPGSYILNVVIKDNQTGRLTTDETTFNVQ